MGTEACKDGLLFGLRGVPEYLAGLCGKPVGNQWERRITDEIAKQGSNFFNIEPQPPYLPAAVLKGVDNPLLCENRGTSRWNGDFYVSLDDCDSLFIECKSIFECVLQKKSIEDSKGRRYFYDYSAEIENIRTEPQKAMTCISIEEAWIDAMKLNCLWQLEESKHHVGLLLLEFDRKGREVSNRRDYKHLEEKLREDGWSQVGRKSWDDKVQIRAAKGFQEHMVLWVKLAKT
jgi:hypothetical protein